MQTPTQTHAVSSAIQKILLRLTDVEWVKNMKILRSILHVPLYFLLGFAVTIWQKGWKSIAICAVVALLDETIKIYLPTREFEAFDLVLDVAGFMIGIGVVTLIRIIRKKD